MSIETVFPKRIISGESSLEYLKELNGKKVFLVLSKNFWDKNKEVVTKVKRYFQEAKINYEVIYSQGQEPTLDYVKESAAKMQQFAPEIIIAIGGGSTLDSAKIMEVFYEYPDISDDRIFERFNLPKIRRKASLIAIPTTSGTGSEVTPYNVVTIKVDDPDMPFIKTTIADYQTIPDVVILDPAFTTSMPAAVTANTGMDALVHAIEAYISGRAENVFSDLYSLEAIRLIFLYLPQAYQNPENMEARAKMQYAATMAGIAIANRGVGLAHGIGQQLGPVFGVRHGLSVSIVLELVLRYNLSFSLEKYINIANYLGLKGKHSQER